MKSYLVALTVSAKGSGKSNRHNKGSVHLAQVNFFKKMKIFLGAVHFFLACASDCARLWGMSLKITDQNGKTLGFWVAKTKKGFNARQKKEIAAVRAISAR